jgi:hypothetical protein
MVDVDDADKSNNAAVNNAVVKGAVANSAVANSAVVNNAVGGVGVIDGVNGVEVGHADAGSAVNVVKEAAE